MENQYRIKRVYVNKKLTETEQKVWRLKLKSMVELTGIVSICLDDEVMFIEYNPILIQGNSIIKELKRINYPMRGSAQVSLYH